MNTKKIFFMLLGLMIYGQLALNAQGGSNVAAPAPQYQGAQPTAFRSFIQYLVWYKNMTGYLAFSAAEGCSKSAWIKRFAEYYRNQVGFNKFIGDYAQVLREKSLREMGSQTASLPASPASQAQLSSSLT